jgi:hypothetical protein
MTMHACNHLLFPSSLPHQQIHKASIQGKIFVDVRVYAVVMPTCNGRVLRHGRGPFSSDYGERVKGERGRV